MGPYHRRCCHLLQRTLFTNSTIAPNLLPEHLTKGCIPRIDFSDSAIAYSSKSFPQLLRSLLVFSTCQVPFIVKNSETMMKTSYKVLGPAITNTAMNMSFFGHFCAGETETTIKPTVDYLMKNGVGSILDYAAEADVEDDKDKTAAATATEATIATSGKPKVFSARIYDYKNEAMCDVHKKTFEKCIDAVKAVSPIGFAAIKCTALGDPELLKRASTALTEVRKLFVEFDETKSGFLTEQQFDKAYSKFFKGGDAHKLFDKIDVSHDGKIDYIEWSNGLPLEELHLLTAHCRSNGPLSRSVLDHNEREMLKRMRERIYGLAQQAQNLRVRLMVDAEHTYFQPAIDNITIDLAKRYNKDFPAIFSTYQMYLKDSRLRLFTDIERAHKGGYKFAAKLVRGAYMVLERHHAEAEGLEDPINENINVTHENYNSAVREVISKIASGRDIEIMIASHNQRSIELTLDAMREHKLSPSAGVYFGQLLGMSDHLTFSLGKHGFKAYKYVPYGRINEVMPYLIRRAQENADALGGAKNELRMTKSEISRRVF